MQCYAAVPDRSLPCCGVRSRRAAGVVLNSDGGDSYAAVIYRLNKEQGWPG